MRILLTGATGYIGKRLIPILLEKGYSIVCCVRDQQRVSEEVASHERIDIIEVDFLKPESLSIIPRDIDVAYYLIHSMSSSMKFEQLEYECAVNFKTYIENTQAKQVIYLSGIVNDQQLSKHLQSRKNVENTLQSNVYDLITFRAGIIVGSGSASFEIIRDLTEKLPIMVAPKWINTKSQPIGIRNVLEYLTKAINNEHVYQQSYDIFGPDTLTYKDMMLQFAEVRKLKRTILSVPVMTPKLSSYWLYFITTTSYKLAKNLVDSMKVEVVGKPSNINEILDIQPMSYKEAVQKAFIRIEQNSVISSWKDSLISGIFREKISRYIKVPEYGCFKDIRKRKVEDEEQTINKIWAIGGTNGWYYATYLWQIRGYLDKMFGGIGLRRGRRDQATLNAGDPLDFWRVLYANKEEKRLLLFAEMRLPGEAWLEFKIEKEYLLQRAIFRPKGIWGRLYWYAVLPFHGFIFNGMISKLVKKEEKHT
ncbi:MAG: SDR family oxidoreductase [Bacteroidota bacterium]